MEHKFGKDVLLSIQSSGGDISVFEVGETEDDPIILRCNSSTGTYEASDKIHLYVEHWAKVNSYSGIEFDENRLMSPDTMGRIYDNVFYNFYQNADDSFGNYGVLFVFDVTEPFENSE